MIVRNETYRDGKVVAAVVVDLTARTLSVEENGVVVSTRPATDEEVAANTPPVPVKSPKEKLKAVLDQITALPAPVLTADVVDLLDDLRTVL